MGALLKLVPSTRIGVEYAGGASKSERHFLDFVINGQSLWEKLARPRDLVSVICYEYSREETIKAVKRLLLTEKAVIPAAGVHCSSVLSVATSDAARSMPWSSETDRRLS